MAGHDTGRFALELFLLGPFRAHVDGVEIAPAQWTRRKAKLLVALLALQPRHQLHREQVMELLWPELAVDQAVNNLHRTIHAARRALEPSLRSGARSRFLATDKQQVLLTAPGGVRVDARELEALVPDALAGGDPRELEHALSLYRGDLLADEPYEAWAAARREALRSARRALDRKLADAYASRGRYDLAAERVRVSLADEPADEDAHRRLMDLYALAGDPSAALRQFDRCRDALGEELDAEPAAETLALRDAIAARAPGPAPPNNLPSTGTRFIGREREKADAVRLLGGARLLTLTGPGGVGKSRLAIELAAASLGAFPAGVRFVELATSRRPEHVARALAAALGVAEARGVRAADAAATAIGAGRALVVFDNCEHLLAACAELASKLLAECPNVVVLATSREPLGLVVETIRRVGPLGVPATDASSAETVRASDAARLFEDRARRHAPDFAITDEIAPSVARLLSRLEGMALAIELAAARAGSAPLDRLADHLDERLPPDRSVRSLVPHHATMRAAIAWSFDLLAPEERRTFARLSIFAGSFGAEAASRVAASAGEPVGDALAALADRSLVESVPPGRYRMLETIREFAAERLAERGEADAIRSAHRAWVCELGDEVLPLLTRREREEPMRRLDAEHANVRRALDSCAEDPGAAEAGLRLAIAMWRFWETRGLSVEGRGWLVRFLAAAVDASVADRIRALEGKGVLESRLGDYETMRETFEERLAIARAAGDASAVANSLHNLGIAHTYMGEHDRAETLLGEARAAYDALGDERWANRLLDSLANVAAARGDRARALALLEEGLAAHRRAADRQAAAVALTNMAKCADDPRRRGLWLEEAIETFRDLGYLVGLVDALISYAEVALDEGEPARAKPLLDEVAGIAAEIGHRHLRIEVLEMYARLESESGDARRALCLAGAVAAQREAEGVPAWEEEREQRERRLEGARAALGDVAAEAALAEGRSLSLDDALRLARS